MIFEHEHEYANQSAAIMAIAPKIKCGRDTLWRWVRQSDIDSGASAQSEGQPEESRRSRTRPKTLKDPPNFSCDAHAANGSSEPILSDVAP
jgi:transposase-like protein